MALRPLRLGDRRPLCKSPSHRNAPYPIARRFHHRFVRPGKWFHLCFVAMKRYRFRSVCLRVYRSAQARAPAPIGLLSFPFQHDLREGKACLKQTQHPTRSKLDQARGLTSRRGRFAGGLGCMSAKGQKADDRPRSAPCQLWANMRHRQPRLPPLRGTAAPEAVIHPDGDARASILSLITQQVPALAGGEPQ